MKKYFQSIIRLCLIGGIVFLSGCDNDDATPDLPTGINVVAGSSLLTDDKGRTLYFFSNDAKGVSSCISAECLNAWPVFYIETPALGTGLAASDFGTITRSDGSKQTTYKTWPLYYFSPTNNGVLESPGETKGDGVGGVWFVAKSNYTVMIVRAQLLGGDDKNYTSTYVEGTEISTFFVDGKGRTLYTFANDTRNNNNFTAADFSNNSVWPIYETSVGDLPFGVNSADFATIDVAGTHSQLTYKGRPLYYFGGNTAKPGDTQRGQTMGVSFAAPGTWPVVNTTTSPALASVNLTQNGDFGKIITDFKGRSLYFFAKDTDGTDQYCTGGVGTTCGGKWPIFYTDVVTTGDASLAATDFDEITLPNGRKQTRYQGRPLYYFSTPGDGTIDATGTLGNDFGNLWFIAKPNYSLMIANAQLIGADGKNYTSNADGSVYTEAIGSTFYFVDAKTGRTVYRHAPDRNGVNSFSNGVAGHDVAWPVYFTSLANLEVPTGMNKADFQVITSLGGQQLTYKGWPLYYYVGDGVRGKNGGISVNAGAWPIVNRSAPTAPN
jgi:predicted lipoprotein with Yx(FWY)xxD motif